MTLRKNAELKGRARMRAELVEVTAMLHRTGKVSDEELEETTFAMLGRDALPKTPLMAPKDIARVRERAKVSQAVMAGFLNVSVSTVSQWERGDRRPGGAALKLLHVVKNKGLDALR